MTHSYLFALTDAGGTTPPELGVARRLVDRGHRVTVYCDPSMMDQALATGATAVPWTSPADGQFEDWNITNPLALAPAMAEHMITGPAPGQAADIAAAIDLDRPDLVLASFFAVGAMAGAESRGVPFDALIPNIYPMPAEGKPPGGAGLSPARGPLGRLRDRIANAASVKVLDRYTLTALNAVRAEHGLAPVSSIWDQVHRARRELILTSAAFEFPCVLPPNARHVGPILDDPSWASGTAWTPPAGDDPLVLVALSSTFQNQADCLQRIADALGGLPMRGVLTTGPKIAVDEIRAPANVTVVGSAPHSEVLREASLVITHGGHGTVMKTLAAGVPMVILHHGRDQADNAVRVVARGAGIAVPRSASSPKIAAAVTEILTSVSYREAAERLGLAIMRDVSGTVLIDELESVG